MNERTISNTGDANDRGRELAWSEGNDEADRSVMRALHRNRDRMPIDHTGVRRNVLGALAQGGASAGGAGTGTGFAGGVVTKIVASIAGLALLGGGLFVLVDASGPEESPPAGEASSNRGSVPTIEHAAPNEISMPSAPSAQDVERRSTSLVTPSTPAKNDVSNNVPNTPTAEQTADPSDAQSAPTNVEENSQPLQQSGPPPVYSNDKAKANLEISPPKVNKKP